MEMQITPYVGIGPIRFGMPKADVREAIPERPVLILKGMDPHFPTDSFEELGIHVHYKNPGVCEAVEVWGTADPFYCEKHLMKETYQDLLSWFRSIDKEVHVDVDGLTSLAFGIALWAPDEPRIDSVFVFDRGYYERYGVKV